MQAEAFESYLRERFEPAMAYYDRMAQRYQRWYRTLQLALIVFSALTPALIAAEALVLDERALAVVAFVASLLVAILASTIKTFQLQENWINYRTTCESLRRELFLYRTGAGPYAGAPTPETLFVEGVEDAIAREHSSWLAVARREPRTGSEPRPARPTDSPV